MGLFTKPSNKEKKLGYTITEKILMAHTDLKEIRQRYYRAYSN
jgi:hypothetical protein